MHILSCGFTTHAHCHSCIHWPRVYWGQGVCVEARRHGRLLEAHWGVRRRAQGAAALLRVRCCFERHGALLLYSGNANLETMLRHWYQRSTSSSVATLLPVAGMHLNQSSHILGIAFLDFFAGCSAVTWGHWTRSLTFIATRYCDTTRYCAGAHGHPDIQGPLQGSEFALDCAGVQYRQTLELDVEKTTYIPPTFRVMHLKTAIAFTLADLLACRTMMRGIGSEHKQLKMPVGKSSSVMAGSMWCTRWVTEGSAWCTKHGLGGGRFINN